MGWVCGNVDSPGKSCLDFPARASAGRPVEASPAIFQGQDVPRVILNERRNLLFLSGVYRWPRSTLLPGILPILGAGRGGPLSMDLSRFSTRCPAPVEFRYC